MTTVAVPQPDLAVGAPEDSYDLLFVGAGASTAYVLLGLLGDLGQPPAGRPHRIGVIERAHDAFGGVPYGSRAARTSLLITSLQDFLPDAERSRFSAWLAANKHWVFDQYLDSVGPYSARWWSRHRAEVERDDFDALYLPRYVFGEYIERRTRDAIAGAEAADVARTDIVMDEVLSVEPHPRGYLVRCRERTVTAVRVVLAAGSPPVRSRLPQQAGTGTLLVDDPFEDMGQALDRIRTALQSRASGRPAHVVLIGGNASSLDMLYEINDLDLPEVKDALFTLLSPRGRLPERMDETRPPAPFVPERLAALADAPEIDAVGIYEAALADITRGQEAGLTVADTLRPISRALGAVLHRLADEQAVEFAGRWGAELGRHQRRAGREYCEVPEHLAREGRLRLVSGAFLDLYVDDDGALQVRSEAGDRIEQLGTPADVVVNCAGPAASLLTSGPSLLTQLITGGVCQATRAGGGIAVDDSLAAAPGLYVMGPLLAGNVVNRAPVWHMEHCGRISSYGSALGAHLARDLTGVTG